MSNNVVKWVSEFVEFLILLLYTLYTYLEIILKNILPQSLKSLRGEVILVTGSGRGIGREICLQLAQSGAKIICWSKTKSVNDDVAREINSRGGEAYAYTVNVGSRGEVQKAAALVRKEVGEVTIVINNAGLMRVTSFLETQPDEIESLFNVNVLSNFWILREFLPGMIERKNGHIISVCSASGILPTKNIVAYSSTKHAVHGYMEALRDELRNHPAKPNIKFTTAYPFYCSTDMLDDSVPNTRFPFFFPIVEPTYVAQLVVEGIRREVEYIYTPVLIGWLAMFSWLVPTNAIAAYAKFLNCGIDPVESEKKK